MYGDALRVILLAQDFVELERLPYNRDYKGILGNILSIGKMGRPRYRCRLINMPGAEAQKFSLVPSKAALPGSQELLWEASVRPCMPNLAAPDSGHGGVLEALSRHVWRGPVFQDHRACLSGVRPACAWLQVQLRRGTWASPMVLGKAYDIRRMTAEQQAARAALQSLGLQVPILA